MAPARKMGNTKNGLIVTLTVPPTRLGDLLKTSPVKEDTPASTETEIKDTKEKGSPPAEPNESPQASGQPAAQANGEAVSDSNPGTPAPNGTPGPMGPPGKKGVKRGAANGEPKSRGKPGPKKRARVYESPIVLLCIARASILTFAVFAVMMVQANLAPAAAAQHTSLVPRQTRELSTPASGPSTDPGNHAGGGERGLSG